MVSLCACDSKPELPPVKAEYKIKPPFDVLDLRAQYGQRDVSSFKCKTAPTPIKDLFFESIYDEDSENSSIVDPAAQAKYREKSKPIRSLESGLAKMANRYVSAKPAEPIIARCTLKWLVIWANNDAFLGISNHMGEFVRKWALASISLAYIQIRDDQTLDEKDRTKVKLWISKLSTRVIEDFSTRTDKTSRKNNHMYWAAWGVTAAGIALDDTAMFNWGIERAKEGIADIQADGSLPMELARGPKALLYHHYAAIPLFMIANAAKKNGIDIYTANDAGLNRLARLLLDNMEDQTYFENITGEKQNLERAITKSNLVWLEPYYARSRDANALRWLAGFRPVKQSRVGGDATLLYGLAP